MADNMGNNAIYNLHIGMINFNNKYLNIISVAILCYLVFSAFKGQKLVNADPQINKNFNASSAVVAIKIDPHKQYKDYNFIEKFVYHLYQKEIDTKFAEIKNNDN